MKPLYIFDIDGTLSLPDHRRHLVENPGCDVCGWRIATESAPERVCAHCKNTGKNPGWAPQWTAFYDACYEDGPNKPVLRTLAALYLAGADIWFFSGRTDRVRTDTVEWLHRYTPLLFDQICGGQLNMRRDGDWRPDDIIKREMLDAMLPADRERLVAVFDDRDRVVNMWRRAGVACFQVAPGAF